MKISIVTAVFNCRDTVEQALLSVARQDHADIEHIVVDGASTDGTLDVLERHRDTLDVLMSEKDRGMYDALNKGIARCTGDAIGFLHADDFFADDCTVSKIAAAFEDPQIGAVYGDLDYVSQGDAGRLIRRWRSGPFSRERLAWGWMPPHPTFYARREVYQRLGAFDVRYRIAADYDCMLRFLGRGGVVPKYIPEVLVKMRVGGMSNRSVANVLRKTAEDYRALSHNGVGGIGALAWKNLSKIRQFFH